MNDDISYNFVCYTCAGKKMFYFTKKKSCKFQNICTTPARATDPHWVETKRSAKCPAATVLRWPKFFRTFSSHPAYFTS